MQERFNQDFPSTDQPLDLSDELASILGMKWQPSSDCFTFRFKFEECDRPLTKRIITSAIAKLFDPSCYLAPTVIRAKHFLQRLWKMNVQWDEPLQGDIVAEWKQFYRELAAVNNLKIPRWMQTTRARSIEIHGFADASEIGYGTVVFIRCVSEDGRIWCNLFTAKTKVAPVKTVTFPKLELSAAELLVRVVENVRKKCHLEYVPFFCYSDSTIVLSWISQCPSKLKTYVATRVKAIQSYAKKPNWSYVPSKQNPADIASRGASAQELIDSSLWWHGPEFLHDTSERDKDTPPEPNEEELRIIKSEYRPAVVANTIAKEELFTKSGIPLIDYKSNMGQTMRITAYVF